MAIDVLKNISIAGISCCVPENTMSSDHLIDALGQDEVRKIKEELGVLSRHLSQKEKKITAGDLCCAAADNLLDTLGEDRQSIDAIIMVTQSGDYPIPATACVLQYRLGLSQDAIAYDIHLDGSGYVYGLHVAATYLQSEKLNKVLLLAGDSEAHMVPTKRPADGAAGSATLVVKDETNGIDMGLLLKSVGDQFRNIVDPHNFRYSENPKVSQGLDLEECFSLQEKTEEVEQFALVETEAAFSRFLTRFALSEDDFDIFVFVGTQKKKSFDILKRKCGVQDERCPFSTDIYGWTSSASMPLTICDYFRRRCPEQRNEGKKNVFLSGIGAGMSVGATAFSIKGTQCLPVITIDEPWDDNMVF